MNHVLLGLGRLRCSYPPSQCVQDERSTDAEADDRGKRHQIQHSARHTEVIREQRYHGTENAEDVKPEGRMNIRKIPAKPNLEQQRGQPDRSHHYQGDGTEKSIRPRIDHDQRERQNEQTRSDHRPSARYARPGTRHQAISSPFRILPLYSVGLSFCAQALQLGIHSAGRCSPCDMA